jgi:hypothetical protein
MMEEATNTATSVCKRALTAAMAYQAKGYEFSTKLPEGFRWRPFLPLPASAFAKTKPKHARDIEVARVAVTNGPEKTTLIILSLPEGNKGRFPAFTTTFAFAFAREDGQPPKEKKIRKFLSSLGLSAEVSRFANHRVLAVERRELSIIIVLRRLMTKDHASGMSFVRVFFGGDEEGSLFPRLVLSEPREPILDLDSKIICNGHPFHFLRSSFVGAFPDLGSTVDASRGSCAADVTAMFVLTRLRNDDGHKGFALWWVSLGEKATLLDYFDANADAALTTRSISSDDGADAGLATSGTAMRLPLVEIAAAFMGEKRTLRLVGYTQLGENGLPLRGMIVTMAVRRAVSASLSDTLSYEFERDDERDDGAGYVLYVSEAPHDSSETDTHSMCYVGAHNHLLWKLSAVMGTGRGTTEDNKLVRVMLTVRGRRRPSIDPIFVWRCQAAPPSMLDAFSLPHSRFVFLVAYYPGVTGDLCLILFVLNVKSRDTVIATNLLCETAPQYALTTFRESTAVYIPANSGDLGIRSPRSSRSINPGSKSLPATWMRRNDYSSCTISESHEQRRDDDRRGRKRAVNNEARMRRADSVAAGHGAMPNMDVILEMIGSDLDSSSDSGAGSSSTARPSSPAPKASPRLSAIREENGGEGPATRRRAHSTCAVSLEEQLYRARTSSADPPPRSIAQRRSSEPDTPTSRRSRRVSWGDLPREPSPPPVPQARIPDVTRPVAIFTVASMVGQIDGVGKGERPEGILAFFPKVVVRVTISTPDSGHPSVQITHTRVSDLFGKGAAISRARPYQDMASPIRAPGFVSVTVAMPGQGDDPDYDIDGVIQL